MKSGADVSFLNETRFPQQKQTRAAGHGAALRKNHRLPTKTPPVLEPDKTGAAKSVAINAPLNVLAQSCGFLGATRSQAVCFT